LANKSDINVYLYHIIKYKRLHAFDVLTLRLVCAERQRHNSTEPKRSCTAFRKSSGIDDRFPRERSLSAWNSYARAQETHTDVDDYYRNDTIRTIRTAGIYVFIPDVDEFSAGKWRIIEVDGEKQMKTTMIVKPRRRRITRAVRNIPDTYEGNWKQKRLIGVIN